MTYNEMTEHILEKFISRDRFQRSFLITAVMLIFGSPLPAQNMTWNDNVSKNPAFNEAFTAYYDAMADYAIEDLRFELFETIEDALSGGSHLSRVPLDHKVRQIETGLFEHLRQSLCHQSLSQHNLDTLKSNAGNSIVHAGNAAQVHFTVDDMGMLTGILVRLIQQKPLNTFCGSD